MKEYTAVCVWFLWLCWVFTAARRLSQVAVSSISVWTFLFAVRGFLLAVAPLIIELRF